MRIPRLNRKGKILRNLMVVILVLFLTAWMLNFPCWTQAGLLHRAERQYLITAGTSQPLCRRDGALYAWTGDRILIAYYQWTPLGFCLTSTDQGQTGEQFILSCDRNGRQEGMYRYPVYTLAGLLENIQSAELQVDVYLPDGAFVGTYVVSGQKEGTNCFTFSLMRKTVPEEESLLAQQENQLFRGGFPVCSAVLRLYGADGQLVESRTYATVL